MAGILASATTAHAAASHTATAHAASLQPDDAVWAVMASASASSLCAGSCTSTRCAHGSSPLGQWEWDGQGFDDCVCSCQPTRLRRNRTVWMFWEQGEDHLHGLVSDGTSKYARDWRCVWGWRTLNPDWDVRVLDRDAARVLAPTYYGSFVTGDVFDRIHRSDALRLELLYRYGGVWADVSVCPVQPLSSWIDGAVNPTGFFSLWRGMRGTTDEERQQDASCHTDLLTHAVFSVTIPNYFLAVRSQLDGFVAAWLTGYADRIAAAALAVRQVPYFLAGCTLTQLLEANRTLALVVENMPHVSPWTLEGNVEPGVAGEPVWDSSVDATKLMYKEKGHHNITDAIYHDWVLARLHSVDDDGGVKSAL